MTRKEKAAQFLEEGYNIFITGRSVHVTEAMKNYALEKMSKIERISDRIIEVNITMDIQRFINRVDIVIKIDHTKIVSEATSNDMYASIDMAIDKIQTQVRKYHERIREHHAEGVSAVDWNANVAKTPLEQEILDINSEIEEETQRSLLDSLYPHAIVARKKMPLKVLTESEAVKKLELSEDTFLLFRQEEDQKLKVLYRKNDGNFGIIEPE